MVLSKTEKNSLGRAFLCKYSGTAMRMPYLCQHQDSERTKSTQSEDTDVHGQLSAFAQNTGQLLCC